MIKPSLHNTSDRIAAIWFLPGLVSRGSLGDSGKYTSMKTISLILFTLIFALPSIAATYFVSNGGVDSNNGTSTSTSWAHSPGMSSCSSKCASTTLQPGDTVKFNRGDIWRNGRITGLPAGSNGSPITLTNYGSGALPKITGSTALPNVSFTLSPGKTFTYQIALSTNPGHYSAENGNALLFESSIASVEAQSGSFWWSANVYYVHPSDNSNPTTNGRVYETSTAFDALDAKPYMTLNGLDIEFGTRFVINANGATNFTLTNSKIAFGGGSQAIWVSSGPSKTSNQTYSNNDISYSDNLIFLYGDNLVVTGNIFHDAVRCTEIQDVSPFSSNILITGNYYQDCGAGQGYPGSSETNAGILVNGSVNGDNSHFNQGVISHNYFLNIHGRAYDGFMGNSTIQNNVMINTLAGTSSDDAIALDINGPNVNVFNNTVLNATNICIQVETTPVSGNIASHIENNLCSNYNGSISWLAYVTNSTAPPVFKNNLYYDAVGGPGQAKFSWLGTGYTFADWAAGTHANTTGEMETAPHLCNPAGLDPRICKDSPAIGAGLNLGSAYQLALNPQSTFPFTTLNQRSAGAGWDIGAFVFIDISGPPPPTGLQAIVE
jgi:hypothetical protein